MSYRYMRLLIFFDLPITTLENKRNYRRFHNELIKHGFIMLQESVYCRLCINEAALHLLENQVESFKPPEGNIMAMHVTEKQFTEIKLISGNMETDVIHSTDRTIIL